MLRRVLSFAFATKAKAKNFSPTEISVGQYLSSYPVSQQILMIVGRPGIGKSYMLNTLISHEYRSNQSDRVFTSSIFNSPEEGHGVPSTQIMSTAKSALTKCMPLISQAGKDEIRATLATALRDGLALMDAPEALPEEMTQEEKARRKAVSDSLLPLIVEVLEKAESPIKPAGINERELLPVLDHCSEDVIFEIAVILIFGSLKEKFAGEIACPLLVSLLNTLSRSLPVAGNRHLPLLFVIENLSAICVDRHSSQFVASLVTTLAKDLEHFNVIMEGYMVSEEFMRAVSDAKEKVLWQFVKPMAVELFRASLKFQVGDITDKEASYVYEATKGDIRTARFLLKAIKHIETEEKSLSFMINFYVGVLDQYFDSKEVIELGDKMVNNSLSQMSFESIRPAIYFAYNLVQQPKGSEMTLEEFFSNPIAQELCYAQICYYDLQTHKISLTNDLIRGAVQHTKAWEILGSLSQMDRNRAAYEKFLQSSQISTRT